MIQLAVIGLLGCLVAPAQALPPTPPKPSLHATKVGDYFESGFSIYGGYSPGGDTLAELSGNELKANGGVSYHIGYNADFKTGRARTALQTAIGFRSNEISEGRTEARFGTIPVDFLGFYQARWLRLGGGLTYHFLPKFQVDRFGSDTDVDFKNQLGYVLAMEIFEKHTPFSFFLGFRYTFITYTPKYGAYLSDTGERISEVDGSTAGIYFGAHF
jgi:hypothetical protein